MKLLALDTSTEWCSVALWLDGEVKARSVEAGQRHSELLLPMIDALLRESGCTLRELDAIAYGAGPGSFTGLRIACGTVQGLAFGARLPVVGVGTLEALAQASGAGKVLCCLDARMQQVYFAAYRRDADRWSTSREPCVLAPAAVVAPDAPQGWTGCGNGFDVYGAALRVAFGSALADVAAPRVPHARDIAALAAGEFQRSGGRPPEMALPVYVRDKVALTIEEQ